MFNIYKLHDELLVFIDFVELLFKISILRSVALLFRMKGERIWWLNLNQKKTL